jgi:general secretion pathway protein J
MDPLPLEQGGPQRSPLKYPPLSTKAGFTLLEVVIAVGILVVILTVVYNTFNSSMKAFTEMETRGDAYAQARVVLNRMSEEIGSIYMSAENRNTGLLGEDREEDNLPFDSLHFTSLSHVRWTRDSKESELCEIGYYPEKDEGTGESFLLRREDWNVDGTLEEGGRPMELAEGVDGINFRYNDGQEWADEWDSRIKGGLPTAVEILLVMSDPRRKRITFSSIVPIAMAGK